MVNLEDYKDYVVVLTNSKLKESVSGLIDDDQFSYANSAQFNNSSLVGMTEGFLRGGISQAASKVAGEIGKSVSSSLVRTVAGTYKAYEISSDTNPSVNFHIYPTNGNYQAALGMLYRLTQPDTENSAKLASYLYDWDYLKDINSDPSKLQIDPFDGKLVHLQIGEWFYADGLFVSGVGLNFSKFVDESGVPIYLQVTVGLTSHKVMNATELLRWTRGG